MSDAIAHLPRNLWLVLWVWLNLPDIDDPVLIQIVGATVAGHTHFHGCALGCFIAYIIQDMLTKQINVLGVKVAELRNVIGDSGEVAAAA